MQPNIASADDPVLAPIRSDERIQALDVVRGCALIGIFLMNIEWFNRPIAEIDAGMPQHVHGIDYFAGWMIYTFVRGKFWTMFSLLFGMGFAVMLGRAQRAGRDFVKPYLRRIGALAIIGAAHYILIWTGDILFSYALGATALVLLFYAQPLLLLMIFTVSGALGVTLNLDMLTGIAASVVVVGLASAFIRGDVMLPIGGFDVPLVSPMLAVVGVVIMTVGVFNHLLGAFFAGAIALAGAWLAIRFRDPPLARLWRAGAFIYLTPFLAMAFSGLVVTIAPQIKPALTAEQKVEAQKQRDEQVRDAREETAAMTGDSYSAAVAYRAKVFSRDAGDDTGFAIIVLGMFLIGAWFVQSGVMADPAAHLPLFRKMVWLGLPIGLGISLLSSAIAVSNIPGQDDARYNLATGLQTLGNLPACLGYVGAIVLMLHSRGPLSRISLLAPAGRMALTNYLCQSVVQSVFFYGYCMGHWGLPRAWQVLFVVVVFSLQVVFSHWWLSKFRYGPMEWLWRAATYWQFPTMRKSLSA
jgi:uncharacterized membrane protein YeiB